MKFLVLDVETLMFPKADPFHAQGRLINVGYSRLDQPDVTIRYYGDDDFSVAELQAEIDRADFLVGHNIKFDAHWLLNIDINLDNVKLWDTALFHYALVAQRMRFISLNQVCEHYGVPTKLDVVKEEYWAKNIDTDKIPREVLSEYLEQDVQSTKEVLQKQIDYWRNEKPTWFTSFRLDCVDIHNTIEMERSGSVLDVKGINRALKIAETRVKEIESRFCERFGGVAINLNSPDQLSAILYGGTITEKLRLPNGLYKSGARAGQTKYSIFEKTHTFEPIFKPPKQAKLKKEGVFSASAVNLLRIKPRKSDKWIIDLLLELSSLTKLIESYLVKMPAMLEERHWENNTIHGRFNHGTTATSRLSSDGPNSQNFPSEFKKFIVTRFD